MEWLTLNIGSENYEWELGLYNSKNWIASSTMSFRNKDDFVAFRLRWGNTLHI